MISLVPLEGIPEVKPGDDLAEMIAAALGAADIGLGDEDVLVVTQKVVSKAEGRVVELASVSPRPEAREWAAKWGKMRARWSLSCRRAPRCCAWRPAA